MRNYFIARKGLHHLVWTYETHAAAHQPVGLNNYGCSMDYHWPGDELIDVIGYSVYEKNWVMPFDADAVSRMHPKALALQRVARPAPMTTRPTDTTGCTLA